MVLRCKEGAAVKRGREGVGGKCLLTSSQGVTCSFPLTWFRRKVLIGSDSFEGIVLVGVN